MIRRTIRGCGYINGYGHHPGSTYLIMIIGLGAIAGLRRGWLGSLLGAAVMGAIFGSMFLIGAYGRGRDSERRKDGS